MLNATAAQNRLSGKAACSVQSSIASASIRNITKPRNASIDVTRVRGGDGGLWRGDTRDRSGLDGAHDAAHSTAGRSFLEALSSQLNPTAGVEVQPVSRRMLRRPGQHAAALRNYPRIGPLGSGGSECRERATRPARAGEAAGEGACGGVRGATPLG